MGEAGPSAPERSKRRGDLPCPPRAAAPGEGGAWGGAWDCDGYRVAVRAPVSGARFCVVGAPASLLSVAGAPPRVVVADDDAVVAPARVAPRDEVVAPTRVALPSSPAAPTTKRPSCCVVS